MFKISGGFSMVITLALSVWVADVNAQIPTEVFIDVDRRVELVNHQNCEVRGVYASPDEIVTWSADCADGLANGMGVLSWFRGNTDGDTTRVQIGLLRAGRKHGQWFEQMGKGFGLSIETGPYEMGKRHGQWFKQTGKNFGLRIETGPYEMGKRHGQWFEQMGRGGGLRIQTGFYEMGKKNGRWFEQFGKGSAQRTETGFYELGKKIGP